MTYRTYLLCLMCSCTLLVVSACSDAGSEGPLDARSDATALDAEAPCGGDPEGDADGDGIENRDEWCTIGHDADGDGKPDWKDFDSDNDGITDDLEAGTKGACAGGDPQAWPCDTDGDGLPDTLDVDSDGDGVDDADEDRNGDGLVGCCISECGVFPLGKDSWQANNCVLNADGCAAGQSCVAGKCTPTMHFKCSAGETSPTAADTFGDGLLDRERGTFICRNATVEDPRGRKQIRTHGSADPKLDAKSGDWHVALERGARFTTLTLPTPDDREAAAAIDHEDPGEEVAGFVVSLPYTADAGLLERHNAIVAALHAAPPGGTGTVTTRTSGGSHKTHDGYDAVRGTFLDLELDSAADPATVRNEALGRILGRTPAELGVELPAAFGTKDKRLVLRMTTIRRFPFKRDATGKVVIDAQGHPQEDTRAPADVETTEGKDEAQRLRNAKRFIVIGAVSLRSAYRDAKRRTGFIVDDISGGTTVAVRTDTVKDQCDAGQVNKLPVADIIWVIDESGSMSGQRGSIVKNASDFFTRAKNAGIDFRMGVTNVIQPTATNFLKVGKFCSKISTNEKDDGGVDRFLGPNEEAIFAACIANPPGYESSAEHGLINAAEAVKRHLPRTAKSDKHLRPGAKTVIIVATDEVPASIKVPGLVDSWALRQSCELPSATQQALDAEMKQYLDLFSGVTDPEAAATFHVIGGVCNNSCGAEIAHGYKELAGKLAGQVGDVCQTDLVDTLQIIIDEIIGATSPVVLDAIPIASSIAVALDGVELQRSRSKGFDYRARSNSLAFIGVMLKKGNQIVVSYKRWARQELLK